MLIKRYNFDEPAIKTKFAKRVVNHTQTWKYYYQQYNKALHIIIDNGIKEHYSFNVRGKALGFLIHQTLELNLKYNLAKSGKEMIHAHDLELLAEPFDEDGSIPLELKEAIEMLPKDPGGDGFRYLTDSDGQVFFANLTTLELVPIIEKINNAVSTVAYTIDPMSKHFDYRSRPNNSNLTLQMQECRYLGHVRFQFNQMIESLLEYVIKGVCTLQDIYLPLLFLIRHSLELAFKDSNNEIQRRIPELPEMNFNHDHSLHRIFKYYHQFLTSIPPDQLTADLSATMHDYVRHYGVLNKVLHDLDANSYAFRFPVDGNNNPYRFNFLKVNFYTILKTLYYTDPFITFTNNVLLENGILPVHEDDFS